MNKKKKKAISTSGVLGIIIAKADSGGKMVDMDGMWRIANPSIFRLVKPLL